MAIVMRRTRHVIGLAILLLVLSSAGAAAQTIQPAPPAGNVTNQSKIWVVFGGTSTTLRGDCQEDCAERGTGQYRNTYSLLGAVGLRINPQMDAGIELSWVPATTALGQDFRSTFILAVAQFRPLASRGLFLKAGMGMTFVRNFVYSVDTTLPPVTSKGLGLTYGIGWTFRRANRVGLQVFGAQHVVGLGDFQSGGTVIADVVGNFWSAGAAMVIR
jgi:hypothetical protein